MWYPSTVAGYNDVAPLNGGMKLVPDISIVSEDGGIIGHEKT